MALTEKEMQYFRCLERKSQVEKIYRICGRIMLFYTLSFIIGNVIYIITCTMNMVLNTSTIAAYPLVQGTVMADNIEEMVSRFPKVDYKNVLIFIVGILLLAGVFFSNRMRVGTVSFIMSGGCLLLALFLIIAAFFTKMGLWLGLSLTVYCLVMAVCSFLELRAFREEEYLKLQEGYPDFNALLVHEETEIPPLPPDADMDEIIMHGRESRYVGRR